jgi:hypothetical protein
MGGYLLPPASRVTGVRGEMRPTADHAGGPAQRYAKGTLAHDPSNSRFSGSPDDMSAPPWLRAGRDDAPPTLAGTFELASLNGSVLPALVEEMSPDAEERLRSEIVAGRITLRPDSTYSISLIGRYGAAGGRAHTREIRSAGTYRFIHSALDRGSGEVALVSANGCESRAALTPISLVHTTVAPSALGGKAFYTWVYLRASPDQVHTNI